MNRRGFISFLIAAPLTKGLPWDGIAKAVEIVSPAIALEINDSITDLVMRTLRARQSEIIKNISENNALLNLLKSRSLVKTNI